MKAIAPFLFVLLWSSGFIGTKFGLMYVEAGDFLTIRTLLNLVVFAGLILICRQKTMGVKQIAHAMVAGLLIHGTYLIGLNMALKLGMPAGLTAIIVGIQPLLTAFLAVLLLKESLTKIQWGALTFGLVGLCLVVADSFSIEGVGALAIVFTLIGLLGITLGTLYQKRFCQNQPMLTSVFWQYFACIFVFSAFSLYQDAGEIAWQFELIASLAWLVIAVSVGAILLLMYMISQGDAAKVSAYFYLVPPVTALMAWGLFDEQLSEMMILGMLISTASVFVMMRKPSLPVVSNDKLDKKQLSAVS